jgi:hypothetical protein
MRKQSITRRTKRVVIEVLDGLSANATEEQRQDAVVVRNGFASYRGFGCRQSCRAARDQFGDGRLSLRERTLRLTSPSREAFELPAALAFFRGAKDDHQLC